MTFNSAPMSSVRIILSSKKLEHDGALSSTGHYYFTVLLLPTLLETAKRSDPGTVRVITTSSSMSYIYNKSDVVYATMRDFEARKKMGSGMLYAQSKFGNTLFAKELARRYATEGITSISLHPGKNTCPIQIDCSLRLFFCMQEVFNQIYNERRPNCSTGSW